MMRAVAPYAQDKGMAISMKLHSPLGSADTILDEFVSIHKAIDHPAFGLCMVRVHSIVYCLRARNELRN